ncbi:hypothetical protein GT002_08795 [Streptomyces sp. SID4917]|nr:hypothetical protein [Streptomyces sp. SID4917]
MESRPAGAFSYPAASPWAEETCWAARWCWRRSGRSCPEKHPRREIVDAIRYVVDTGCTWRALINGLAISHKPSGTIQLHVPRPYTAQRPTAM